MTVNETLSFLRAEAKKIGLVLKKRDGAPLYDVETRFYGVKLLEGVSLHMAGHAFANGTLDFLRPKTGQIRVTTTKAKAAVTRVYRDGVVVGEVTTNQRKPVEYMAKWPDCTARKALNLQLRENGLTPDQIALVYAVVPFTPFWFEGNMWFKMVNTDADLLELLAIYAKGGYDKDAVMKAQECERGMGIKKFGFASECRGALTLGGYLKV